MSLAIIKYLHTLIWIEPPINDQVIHRVNYLETKEKQPENNKGYPIFELIPGILITEKNNTTQNKDDVIASTNEDEDYDDITENG